jgi:hypothetical protein
VRRLGILNPFALDCAGLVENEVENVARYCESINTVRSEKKPVVVEVFDLTPPVKHW